MYVTCCSCSGSGCSRRDSRIVRRCEPMNRDGRVDADGYAEQDPARVARQLEEAAYLFANVLARLAPADWDRTVMYNYPKLFERSMRWVAVHTVHEVRHHLLDVRRQFGVAPALQSCGGGAAR